MGNGVGELQRRAWSFYGTPNVGPGRAVGEVHYVNGWLADQMTRLDWDVFINGSPVWEVTTADGERISTTRKGPPDSDGKTVTEQDQTGASKELLSLVGWDDTNIKAVTTNLFVAGQGTYIFDFPRNRWRVVSVIEPERVKVIEKARERVEFIWPHPADPSKPDAPLFSVLEVLEELDWLNRQARTQSHQRAMISGFILSADEFDKPGESTFWDKWNTAMRAKMEDPDDLSPIHMSGPKELIQEGVKWIIPDYGYDDKLDRRVTAAIQRLAYGLPIPPEILLGLQASSRATAFQVEENAYRAHIEPPAWMVAGVPQAALIDILDDVEVTVRPNPARLLARLNSVQDVKDAYDRHEVSGDYLREVLRIPDDAAPKDAEQSQAVVLALDLVKTAPSLAQNPGLDALAKQIGALLQGADTPNLNRAIGSADPAPKDPANVAADEPITAAATDDGEDLAQLLSDIDFHLSSELVGATTMATDRARQRLGAAARTVKAPGSKDLKNSALAAHLGLDGLEGAGVDIAAQISEPIDALKNWWVARVEQAYTQAAELVPGYAAGPDWINQSATKLEDAMTAHVVTTLSVEPTPPLDAVFIKDVVDAAAGGAF